MLVIFSPWSIWSLSLLIASNTITNVDFLFHDSLKGLSPVDREQGSVLCRSSSALTNEAFAWSYKNGSLTKYSFVDLVFLVLWPNTILVLWLMHEIYAKFHIVLGCGMRDIELEAVSCWSTIVVFSWVQMMRYHLEPRVFKWFFFIARRRPTLRYDVLENLDILQFMPTACLIRCFVCLFTDFMDLLLGWICSMHL